MTLVSGCRYADATESICLSKLQSSSQFFDLDHDSEARPESDGILFLRHFLGFRETKQIDHDVIQVVLDL